MKVSDWSGHGLYVQICVRLPPKPTKQLQLQNTTLSVYKNNLHLVPKQLVDKKHNESFRFVWAWSVYSNLCTSASENNHLQKTTLRVYLESLQKSMNVHLDPEVRADKD